MDFDFKSLEYTILVLGLLSASALILEPSLFPQGAAVGYDPADENPCCSDCSCVGENACAACHGCCFTNECRNCVQDLGTSPFALIHASRVESGSSFTVNVALISESDKRYLVELQLPNGFRAQDENPIVVDLMGNWAKVVPFTVSVRDHVAEQDHIVRAKIMDSDWETVSEMEGVVSVYWADD